MKFEISGFNIITSDIGSSNDDFWINIQVDISEFKGHGAETFNVNVVSVVRLNRIVENEDIIGRGIIITKEFSEDRLRKFIENLLKKIDANNWQHLLIEFEKYFEHM